MAAKLTLLLRKVILIASKTSEPIPIATIISVRVIPRFFLAKTKRHILIFERIGIVLSPSVHDIVVDAAAGDISLHRLTALNIARNPGSDYGDQQHIGSVSVGQGARRRNRRGEGDIVDYAGASAGVVKILGESSGINHGIGELVEAAKTHALDALEKHLRCSQALARRLDSGEP